MFTSETDWAEFGGALGHDANADLNGDLADDAGLQCRHPPEEQEVQIPRLRSG
jgi:hypothetical protein